MPLIHILSSFRDLFLSWKDKVTPPTVDSHTCSRASLVQSGPVCCAVTPCWCYFFGRQRGDVSSCSCRPTGSAEHRGIKYEKLYFQEIIYVSHRSIASREYFNLPPKFTLLWLPWRGGFPFTDESTVIVKVQETLETNVEKLELKPHSHQYWLLIFMLDLW